ncbi:MAG: hypothetical protein ACE5EC_07845, partial [Phycisphaerae bacterium]
MAKQQRGHGDDGGKTSKRQNVETSKRQNVEIKTETVQEEEEEETRGSRAACARRGRGRNGGFLP